MILRGSLKTFPPYGFAYGVKVMSVYYTFAVWRNATFHLRPRRKAVKVFLREVKKKKEREKEKGNAARKRNDDRYIRVIKFLRW